MSDKKGWPLTQEFLDGMAKAAVFAAEAVFQFRTAALDAMEATVIASEIALITEAKVLYIQESGERPTLRDLHDWAAHNGNPTLAAFLWSQRRNPTITGLFQPTTQGEPS